MTHRSTLAAILPLGCRQRPWMRLALTVLARCSRCHAAGTPTTEAAVVQARWNTSFCRRSSRRWPAAVAVAAAFATAVASAASSAGAYSLPLQQLALPAPAAPPEPPPPPPPPPPQGQLVQPLRLPRPRQMLRPTARGGRGCAQQPVRGRCRVCWR